MDKDYEQSLWKPQKCYARVSGLSPRAAKKSLAKQDRIVAVLDRFDTIANSIREGLPHEIKLRQKQYEHYRNLLFSFPKPEEVTA
jgi:type I restriction enzyme S subunit